MTIEPEIAVIMLGGTIASNYKGKPKPKMLMLQIMNWYKEL